MAVHHVEMDPVGAGLIDRAHLLAEPCEIGGQDRRGDRAAGASISFDKSAASVSRRRWRSNAPRQRLEHRGHQVDRELRDREIEPGEVRHARGAPPRRRPASIRPHVAVAGGEPERQRLRHAEAREHERGQRRISPSESAKDSRVQAKHFERLADDRMRARRPSGATAKKNSAITLSPSMRSLWRVDPCLAGDSGAPAARRSRRRPAARAASRRARAAKSPCRADEQRGEHRRGRSGVTAVQTTRSRARARHRAPSGRRASARRSPAGRAACRIIAT